MIAAAAQTLPETDRHWAVVARQSLANTDAQLYRHFHPHCAIEYLLALRARAVDRLIRAAWQRCIPDDAELALLAVGGYGRAELFPHSDIDLRIIAEPSAQHAHEAALARLFALLWDAGLPVSHAVASIEQSVQAATDLTVYTALLESRPLCAATSTHQALHRALTVVDPWPAHLFFLARREKQQQRHQRFGDIASNLEPYLKDGPGSLRDLHTLAWVARRTFGTANVDTLFARGYLGMDETAALKREWQVLARLRFGLHHVAGRAQERLGFEQQRALAQCMGFDDETGNLAVEKMMQGFYRSVTVIRRVSDRMLQRFEEYFDGPSPSQALDSGFSLQCGWLVADDPHWPHDDISQVFALFDCWARTDPRCGEKVRGLHSQTARGLAEMLDIIPSWKQVDLNVRRQFMALLHGPGAVNTLIRMARLGVLERWLPAFAHISGRMQFDLFHVYTVDQHTLMVLRTLGRFSRGQANEHFTIVQEVWKRLRQPELLLLAALFHDIGKGRGGDHAEIGANLAEAFCLAHDLSQAETALVVWLVQQHLMMSITAQKQDITDPQVICRFAKTVASRERLDYLYLLTCADIIGTRPSLWNAWKDRLLADLYFASRRYLHANVETPLPQAQRVLEARAQIQTQMRQAGHCDSVIDPVLSLLPDEGFVRFRPEQLLWQADALRDAKPRRPLVRVRPIAVNNDALEVFVYSPSRDGLFAAIVISLDRAGYGIQRARALDGIDDTVFDTFEIIPIHAFATPQIQTLENVLQQTLAGDFAHLHPIRHLIPQQLKHFRFAPRIEFVQQALSGATILNLTVPDRPGLLADIAYVLYQHHVRVHDARIATFGERAEDQFRLTDQQGKVLDHNTQHLLSEALLQIFSL